MKRKHKKRLWLIEICVCVIGFLLCVTGLIYYWTSIDVGEEVAVKVHMEPTDVIPTPKPTLIPTPTPIPTPIPTPEPIRVVIDGKEYPNFADLEVPPREKDIATLQVEENEHIYAWIYIPNTNINYPVLQHPDKADYYLNHDTKGNKVIAGSIYTQYYNDKDFNDNLTVIYGHNMKNGSMFKSLHYYEDEVFFKDNPYVYVYTETQTRVYQIFGAYEYSDSHLLLNADMSKKKIFEKYLNSLKEDESLKGIFDWSIDVTGEDKVLTLSTCISGKPKSRFLVQAKLIAVEDWKPQAGVVE